MTNPARTRQPTSSIRLLPSRRGGSEQWQSPVHARPLPNRVVKDTQVDVAGMESYFRQWVRACLRISWDAHLKSGGILDWTLTSRVADEEILALTGGSRPDYRWAGRCPERLSRRNRCVCINTSRGRTSAGWPR